MGLQGAQSFGARTEKLFVLISGPNGFGRPKKRKTRKKVERKISAQIDRFPDGRKGGGEGEGREGGSETKVAFTEVSFRTVTVSECAGDALDDSQRSTLSVSCSSFPRKLLVRSAGFRNSRLPSFVIFLTIGIQFGYAVCACPCSCGDRCRGSTLCRTGCRSALPHNTELQFFPSCRHPVGDAEADPTVAQELWEDDQVLPDAVYRQVVAVRSRAGRAGSSEVLSASSTS